MSLETSLDSPTARHAARLQGAPHRIARRIAGIQNEATRKLLRAARAVVHVKSGRLQSNLAIYGPFTVGEGVLESQIAAPSVPYADEEVARGGAHDFPAQTLEQGAAIIDQMERGIELMLIEETGAGGS